MQSLLVYSACHCLDSRFNWIWYHWWAGWSVLFLLLSTSQLFLNLLTTVHKLMCLYLHLRIYIMKFWILVIVNDLKQEREVQPIQTNALIICFFNVLRFFNSSNCFFLGFFSKSDLHHFWMKVCYCPAVGTVSLLCQKMSANAGLQQNWKKFDRVWEDMLKNITIKSTTFCPGKYKCKKFMNHNAIGARSAPWTELRPKALLIRPFQ